MKYKLKLISPGFRNMNSSEFKSLMFRFWFPSLSMPMIAAVTPKDDFEISFCDELFNHVDFDEPVDIVGITGMTAQISRGYAVADEYRKRGIPVIMGGIHASTLPHESKLHADSVMIGESEKTWPIALEDFKRQQLKPFYKTESHISLSGMANPNREIYNTQNTPARGTINSIQTTRGCPNNCDFCSVTNFFGNQFRTRLVDEVIAEISLLKGTTYAFIDDNIVGDPRYALELFTKLSELKITWTGQSSITIAKNEELLKACAKSGCKGLLIGIESINANSLKSVNKQSNKVEEYYEAIKRIQNEGISVLGSFIFGLEDDDESVFENTLDFICKSRISFPAFNILTPYPGTRVYKKYLKENRIISHDWSLYTSMNVVYQPKKMTPEQLHEGYRWTYKNLHKSMHSNLTANLPLIT